MPVMASCRTPTPRAAQAAHLRAECHEFGVAEADAPKLQRFVCGLRRLVQPPLDRADFLWRRAAMTLPENPPAPFDHKVQSLASSLRAQREDIEQRR